MLNENHVKFVGFYSEAKAVYENKQRIVNSIGNLILFTKKMTENL